MVMYVGFDFLAEREGKHFIHPDHTVVSGEEPDTKYVIRCEDYPEQFDLTEELDPRTGEPEGLKYGPLNRFYEGAGLFPRWSFDPEKYERGENPFERFDPKTATWCRRALRRQLINERLDSTMKLQTEVKKLRRALKEVVAYIRRGQPDFLSDGEFDAYDATVEACIAEYPKDAPETEKKASRLNAEHDTFFFPLGPGDKDSGLEREIG